MTASTDPDEPRRTPTTSSDHEPAGDDGGSKYTNPTGDGYRGIYTLKRHSASIAIGIWPDVTWTPSDDVRVWLEEVNGQRVLAVGLEPPAKKTWPATVTYQREGTSVSIPSAAVKRIDYIEYDGEIRVYKRQTDGLHLVPADPSRDPMVATDGGHDEAVQERNLGRTWYVVAEPRQDPARVVDGPFDDRAQARRRADVEPGLAEVKLALWLVYNIREEGYNVEWAAGVDRPAALAIPDGGHAIHPNRRLDRVAVAVATLAVAGSGGLMGLLGGLLFLETVPASVAPFPLLTVFAAGGSLAALATVATLLGGRS